MNINSWIAQVVAVSHRARAIAVTRRAGRRDSAAGPSNEETATMSQVVPVPGRRGRVTRRVRRPMIGLATALCTLALGLGAASAAQAQVNPGGPHYYFPWGDCSVALGNVAWTGGAAVGGADISCKHYHSYIGATVQLMRWDGYRWVDVRNGGGDTTTYTGFRSRLHRLTAAAGTPTGTTSSRFKSTASARPLILGH
jgi:hypothetical protein